MDERAYRTYSDYFNQPSTKATKKKIVFLVLALMNGVQAVYHYPGLRESVDFRIVYLEIQERQEIFHTGEQGKAYEAFCSYQLNIMKGNSSVFKVFLATYTVWCMTCNKIQFTHDR